MNFKKYFQFTETISGTTYFLRNLLVSILGYLFGYGIGHSMVNNELETLLVFVFLLSPVLWFSLTTIYKRFNALQPEHATVLTAVLFGLQIIRPVTQANDVAYGISTLILLVFGIYLIFADSNIREHEG
jgi:uncharacterized membrane protein YhaH (DUF805 family)